MIIKVINRRSHYFDDLIQLAYALWPDNIGEALKEETIKLMKTETFFGAIENNVLVGFIQLSIRNDYVNDTETSPVGFIEGICVLPNYQRKGIAKALIAHVSDVPRKKKLPNLPVMLCLITQ